VGIVFADIGEHEREQVGQSALRRRRTRVVIRISLHVCICDGHFLSLSLYLFSLGLFGD